MIIDSTQRDQNGALDTNTHARAHTQTNEKIKSNPKAIGDKIAITVSWR